MDPVLEIKARLSIEDLVGQYCQLQKKGRSYVCLCPFHNDSHPSFLVSPEKGIAYCFACQKGGDIFSFYQLIEGVDFPQAIKELADKTGVVIDKQQYTGPKKDEKERMRECLQEASRYYRAQLKEKADIAAYLAKRGVSAEEAAAFGIGYAPESFTATYDHLLRSDFSRQEVAGAGLSIQRDIDGKTYDRFRHRLMFEIRDLQGRIIGFGGRTMGDDDAKYVNSPDGPLYHKSNVLFGLDRAKEKMRETNTAIVVEGYFDVLACHRVGATNAVAACGTALTEEHVKILKRYVDTVVLCLDTDRAGRAAAERAFPILVRGGLQVHAVLLPEKDPADMAVEDATLLQSLLTSGAKPYVQLMIEESLKQDLSSAVTKRAVLQKLLQLLRPIPSSLERAEYVRAMASAFGVGETELDRDLSQIQFDMRNAAPAPAAKPVAKQMFSATEVALGFFFHYPQFLALAGELIEPEEQFARELHTAFKILSADEQALKKMSQIDIGSLQFSTPEFADRARILALYFEQDIHRGLSEWSDGVALRELRRNIHNANREMLRRKQQEIARKLAEARAAGRSDEEAALQAQSKQLLSIAKVAA